MNKGCILSEDLVVGALRRHISAAGIQQKYIASKMNYSQPWVSTVLCRTRSLRLGDFFRFCGALGLDPVEFLGRIQMEGEDPR